MTTSFLDSERLHSVVFIRTDRLGETLLNLPAMAALRAALPHARLTVLVHEDLVPIFSAIPWIDQAIAYHPGPRSRWWIRALRLQRKLRSLQSDLAVVSNPSKELHLAVWLARIPWRVGYRRKWGGLLTHRLEDRKALGERHEVEYNLDLVRTLGLPTAATVSKLPQWSREHAEVIAKLQEQGVGAAEPFVAVHPWTSNPLKQWPAERYRLLIQRLAQELTLRVVIIGGPAERAGLPDVLPVKLPVIDLVGRLSLRQLVELLRCARALVSNDSGPVHVAAAAGTRTIVLFGTSDPASGPKRWGPWGEGHTVISKPSMDAITVDDVTHALRRLLQRLR